MPRLRLIERLLVLRQNPDHHRQRYRQESAGWFRDPRCLRDDEDQAREPTAGQERFVNEVPVAILRTR